MAAWIQNYIMEREREGGLAVPPPVLTRMHAIMSDCMLGYEQCRRALMTYRLGLLFDLALFNWHCMHA